MKITLLGDSIRLIGYGKRLPALLPEAEIYQPTENCRYARHTLRMIYEIKDKISESDLIHWNNGLWDTCSLFGDGIPFTPIDEYVSTMVAVAEQLLRITKNVIFSTTTPVLPTKADNSNERINAYNAAVVPRLREMGVIINDLGGVISQNLEKYIRADDKIHLTDEGIEVAAESVKSAIIGVLGEKIAARPLPNACAGRKSVLILTDLEGITGVDRIEDIARGTEQNKRACEALTYDTNIAASALFDAGAERVFAVDGHGGGGNFVEELLDPRVINLPLLEMQKVMNEISAVVMIGMHAAAGTECAFLDHTQNSAKIHRYFYNGKAIGEMSQMGFYSGYFGVPCIAVSGDTAACREACEIFPDISTAEVKRAQKRNTALSLTRDEADKLIYSAVRDGYLRRGEILPYKSALPLTVDVEFNRTDYTDEAVEKHPNLRRISPFTVREVKESVNNYLDVLIVYG